MNDSAKSHRNDIYGDLEKKSSSTPATPAATVVLLRETENGPEVLMLRKNSKIAFGGMWVFPGGRIDEEDYPEDRDLETAARTAARREAAEEAGIDISGEDFHWFAHWTPPASTPVRFATWFFVANTKSAHQIQIDDGEIKEYMWLQPGAALERHAKAEIDLAPPTWVTLYTLARSNSAEEFISKVDVQEPRTYETHVAKRSDGVRVAMWEGDSGYTGFDADSTGEQHRLIMSEGGFEFIHPDSWY